MHISDVTLILTFSLRPKDPQKEPALLDFLVGPTRAKDLEAVILEQRSLCAVRLQMQTLYAVSDRLTENRFLADKFLEDAVGLCGALEVLLLESLGELKKMSERKLSPDDAITEKMHERRHCKAILYINSLRAKCSALVQSGMLPDLWENENRATEAAEQILSDIDHDCPVRLDGQSIATRVDAIVSHAARFVRRLILCRAERITADDLDTIGRIIEMFHDRAKKTVAVYESSDAGEELKVGVVRLLINSNTILADHLRPPLTAIGYQCSDTLGLIDENRFGQLADWYSNSLVISIKSWLRKNLEHMSSNKTIVCLPWDFEKVDDKLISHLPETFRFQLNAFYELCSKLDVHVNDGSHRSIRNQQLLMLNEKIIAAVCSSLTLLADEYARALQSKHWAEGAYDEVDDHMKFLIACANDAQRIQTVHVAPIFEVQTTSDHSRQEVVGKVKADFEVVRLDALKRLSHVIFADLQDYLSAFDAQWSKSDGNALIGTILATLEDYWADVSRFLEQQNFLTLLGIQCRLCCGKYLMFLRGRTAKKSQLSFEESNKLVEDTTRLRKCYKQWVKKVLDGKASDAASNVYRSLQQLNDVVQLLTLTPTNDLRPIVADLLARYDGEDRPIARELLKLVSLRPDYDLEMINLIATEEKKCPPGVSDRSDRGSYGDLDLLTQVFRKAIDDDISKNGTPDRRSKNLKAIREMAADFNLSKMKGTSLRKHSYNASIETVVGYRGPSLSRQSSRGDVQQIRAEEIHSSDLCHVQITNIKVRGLASGSLLSLCNPYIAFTIGSQRFKTSVQWNKKSEAAWDNEVITIPSSRSRLSASVLLAEVFDKERIRRKQALGDVQIKLSALDLHPLDSWFALNCVGPSKNCEIYLNVRLFTSKE